MAKGEEKSGKAPDEGAEAQPRSAKVKAPPLPLLLGALNVLAVLAAVGTLTYTRLLFKRPVITEETEREKLDQAHVAAKTATSSGYVPFDPLTVNIASSPPAPKPAEGMPSQIQGKLHYATIGFSLEIRDISQRDKIEAIKPLIVDQFLAIVGRKQFHELTSIQGRYILKTQLIEMGNGLIAKRQQQLSPETGDPLIVNLYFSQFIVQ